MAASVFVRAVLAGFAGGVLVVSGCASSPGGPVNTPTPEASTPRVEPTAIRTPPATPTVATSTDPTPGALDVESTPAPVPDAYLSAIRADLEQRGVSVGDLAVESSVAVTWRDGSLGCPQPGMMYIQALEPGMRVVVRARGQAYDYRFGQQGLPRLCEQSPQG